MNVQCFFLGEHVSALALCRVVGPIGKTVIKIRDWHLKGHGQLPDARGRHAVGTAFVFLDLLKPDPDLLRQLQLGQAKKTSAPPNAIAEMLINIAGHKNLPCPCNCLNTGQPGNSLARRVPISR